MVCRMISGHCLIPKHIARIGISGPDDLPEDVLELSSTCPVTILFTKIYETGIIPEWCRSTFVAIPKKQNAKKCE